MDPNEKFARALIPHREIAVPLTPGDEDRIRAYMDRTNHEPGGDVAGPYILDAEDEVYEEELSVAMGALIQRALDLVEGEYGLRGLAWGEIVSEEVARHALAQDGTL